MLYDEAYLSEIRDLFWEATLFRHLANQLAQGLTVVGIVSKATSQIQILNWENKKRG